MTGQLSCLRAQQRVADLPQAADHQQLGGATKEPASAGARAARCTLEGKVG
jgi:hypothetical protein